MYHAVEGGGAPTVRLKAGREVIRLMYARRNGYASSEIWSGKKTGMYDK